MDKDSTGFTPVRRSTKYDQDSPRGCTASVSWTSARCKRLLRPITSRLATLRKEARCGIKEFQKPQNDLGEGMEQHGLRLDASIVSEKAPVSQNSGLDEDWLSRGPRKRIRRTYSKKDNAIQRSRHPSNTVENTPKITLVQPLLRIDQQLNLITTPFPSHLVNPPQKDDILNQSSKVSVQRNGKVSRHNFKSLARNVRPSQWVLYDGIFAGLDTLLTATAPTSLPKRTGVSSLFSTCIRKVPDWIALEEQEAIALHIDLEEDVESSIFDELENLSTSTDGCWKPFRDICRSQAILLLQRAIQDGLIPLSLADSFVHLLIDHQAIREAKTLVRTMISMVKGIRNPDNQAETFYSHEISYSLQALNRLGKDHIGFLFEMVTLLQEKGAFSKEWCTHPDFIHIWNRALYSITISDSYCARAVHLLEISMKRWGSHCFPNGRRDSTTIQSSTRDCISWATLFYDIIAALVSVLHTISMPCDLGKTPAVLPGYCRQALKSLALSADLDSFGETQGLRH